MDTLNSTISTYLVPPLRTESQIAFTLLGQISKFAAYGLIPNESLVQASSLLFEAFAEETAYDGIFQSRQPYLNHVHNINCSISGFLTAQAVLFETIFATMAPDPWTMYKLERDAESAHNFDTRQVHSGARPDPTTKARAVPIYQTAVRL